MEKSDSGEEIGAAGLETIVAAQLHVNDVVRRQGALRVVTSLRMQGAPAEVCVEFAGLVGRQHYPADAQVDVLRRRRSWV